jgi:hypothetical protein
MRHFANHVLSPLLIGLAAVACSSGSNTSQGGPQLDGALGNGGGTSSGGGASNGGASATGGSKGTNGGTSGASGGGGTSGTNGGGGTSGTNGGGTSGTNGNGGSGTPPDGGMVGSNAWLKVVGTKLVTGDGKPFHGRGANLHDTRSCNACTAMAPNPQGLNAWADELIDTWHANFIRFDLEAYADNGGYRVQWKSLLDDPGYYADIQTVVHHMTSKPGVYVMVTLFTDPSQVPDNSAQHSEWPTDTTQPVYQKLAEAFYNDPQVLFGLMNEPHDDASHNADLAAIFTKSIQTIRAVEQSHGTPAHIVVAQAAQGYARDLSYWVANPLGANVAYETHPYNPQSDFDSLFVQPSKKIPVIIGEFGPATIGSTVYMTLADAQALMAVAETNEIPYIGWNFHQRCPPNMLNDTGGNGYDGCGFVGAGTIYTWPPTAWGQAFKDRLAQAY